MAMIVGGGQDLAGGGNHDGMDTTGDGGGHVCATIPGTPTLISGHISVDTTLTCDQLYLFSGTVIVDGPATLTIERGTTIVMASDGSLIVTTGAKLVAIGTADEPILFTSASLPGTRKPGDWGSIALVGKAPGNWGLDGSGNVMTSHTPDANDWPGGFPYVAGGSNPTDGSGTLKYVRIEYGGAPRIGSGMPTQHEILGLYGVGSGTTIEYIDMRQGNFGCLFAEGGGFNARHLVCQWSGNGGFDFTRGNVSRAQFLLDQESPTTAAEGLGFKGPFDSNIKDPRTNPTVYNVTVCGTNGSPATVKDPYALFMKRDPIGLVANFIGVGFHAGLGMVGGLNGPATTQLHSAILFGNFDVNIKGTNIAYPKGSDPNYPNGNDTDLPTWFSNPAWNNATTDPTLTNCFNFDRLEAAPATALTTNASTPPNDGFFDPTATYLGAFRDVNDTWASGNWVVWSSN
jgi:hypothetical protein